MTMADFVLFLFSITLWMVSLFLVGEAAKSQKWAFGGAEGLTDPYAGVAMSQVVSLLFIFLWFLRIFFMNRPAQDPLYFLSQLLVRPQQLTPGILLANFPPLILGIVKLITALVVSRGSAEDELKRRNRLWVTVVFVALHLIIALVTTIVLARLL
jgi:hypothetical protein